MRIKKTKKELRSMFRVQGIVVEFAVVLWTAPEKSVRLHRSSTPRAEQSRSRYRYRLVLPTLLR